MERPIHAECSSKKKKKYKTWNVRLEMEYKLKLEN